MYCRRCSSPHLLRLEKKLPQDNEVFRCQECGFLFSPSGPAPGQPRRVGAMGGAGPPPVLAQPGE